MRQKLRRLQQGLGSLYLPILFVITMLLLMALGYSDVKPTTYEVELNQVAQETIRAPRTVEDKEATERSQQAAVDAVQDVLVFDTDSISKQQTIIRQFFQAIRNVQARSSAEILSNNTSSTSSESTTTTEATNRVATTQERVQYFKKTLERDNQSIRDYAVFIPDRYISQLLLATTAQLSSYESTLNDIVATQMANPISESTLETVRETAKRSLYYNDYSDSERDLLNQLVDVSVNVNNVVDKEATDRAKETARANVNPVRILQGQVVVQEGHIISANDIRVLELLGIGKSTPNYHELISYLLLLVGMMGFLVAYVRSAFKDESVNHEEVKLSLTVFSCIFVVSVFLLKVLAAIQDRGVEQIGLVFPMAGVIYLIYRLTKNLSLTIASIVLLPIFSWFLFAQATNSTNLILITVFMSIVAWFGILQERTWREQSWIIQLAKHIGYSLLLGVPFIFYSNYELWSSQSGMLLGFMALSGFLSFFIPLVAMPYLSYLFEDSSVLLWAELSNPNQPLLKELITKAPGTYHHSLMVANISANCVEAIGGDSQLARVACYYHDIGKTEHPFFFIENLPANMESPHKQLSPYESAQIIFGHVTNGVEILKQHQLPQGVIDICAQHHGTTLMKYFYAEALKTNPDVTEEEFRYPGPKPQTKEAAVINIVDSAEAATRAMKEPTLEKVEKLVRSIIMSRLEDDQFTECDITTHELAIVEKMIVTSLNGTFHSRIEYPTLPKKS